MEHEFPYNPSHFGTEDFDPDVWDNQFNAAVSIMESKFPDLEMGPEDRDSWQVEFPKEAPTRECFRVLRIVDSLFEVHGCYELGISGLRGTGHLYIGDWNDPFNWEQESKVHVRIENAAIEMGEVIPHAEVEMGFNDEGCLSEIRMTCPTSVPDMPGMGLDVYTAFFHWIASKHDINSTGWEHDQINDENSTTLVFYPPTD